MPLTLTRPLLLATNGLLLALITITVYQLWSGGTYNAPDNSPYIDGRAVSTVTRSANELAVTDPLKFLLGANLFGATPRDQAPPPAVHAPPTKLNLQLHGVVMAQDPAKARAIISSANGLDRSYGLNDTLPGNARITHVYTDRVILRRDGHRESLQLSLPIGQQPRKEPPAGTGPGNASVHRATITGFRQQFIRDPAVLADYIAAEAVTLKTGQSGWRLAPGRNSEVFTQLGLKPGDLVLAINDVVAGQGMSRIRLLNELATADELKLKVLRKEKVLSFYFTMNN